MFIYIIVLLRTHILEVQNEKIFLFLFQSVLIILYLSILLFLLKIQRIG